MIFGFGYRKVIAGIAAMITGNRYRLGIFDILCFIDYALLYKKPPHWKAQRDKLNRNY
jgi:hypothetical protein